MRHALAISLSALALTGACARSTDPDMQPDPGTGYTVRTTGAEIVGRDNPSSTDAPEPSFDDITMRLAAEICDREVRCHAAARTPPPRSAEDCWRANLGRMRYEVGAWRCSPAGMRARAKDCLAAIGNEKCDFDLSKRRSLCVRNQACGRDAEMPTAGLR